jgi:hypothetical protein
MNANRQTRVTSEHDKESTMSVNPSTLIRWSGLAAVLAGIIFAAIQPIHPPDVGASVSTTAWHIITPLKFVMCLLFLVGITGIYARQVKQAGWLGLTGFALLIFTWWLQASFVFVEAFLAPPLTSRAPAFVDALVGISWGHTHGVDLGAMPSLYAVMGLTYMLGGLVFGIATVRAGILPRWAAGLLAVTATLTPLAALLPHAQQRYAAVPMGIALACLGYSLLTERREPATSPAPGTASAQLHPAEVR